MKESPAKLFRKAPTLLHLFNHQNEDAGERHHNDCRREHQSVRAGSHHNGGGDNRADHLTESSGNVQNAQILPGLFFIRQNVNIERLIDGSVWNHRKTHQQTASRAVQSTKENDSPQRSDENKSHKKR